MQTPGVWYAKRINIFRGVSRAQPPMANSRHWSCSEKIFWDGIIIFQKYLRSRLRVSTFWGLWLIWGKLNLCGSLRLGDWCIFPADWPVANPYHFLMLPRPWFAEQLWKSFSAAVDAHCATKRPTRRIHLASLESLRVVSWLDLGYEHPGWLSEPYGAEGLVGTGGAMCSYPGAFNIGEWCKSRRSWRNKKVLWSPSNTGFLINQDALLSLRPFLAKQLFHLLPFVWDSTPKPSRWWTRQDCTIGMLDIPCSLTREILTWNKVCGDGGSRMHGVVWLWCCRFQRCAEEQTVAALVQ
jgi:hypothetical protein